MIPKLFIAYGLSSAIVAGVLFSGVVRTTNPQDPVRLSDPPPTLSPITSPATSAFPSSQNAVGNRDLASPSSTIPSLEAPTLEAPEIDVIPPGPTPLLQEGAPPEQDPLFQQIRSMMMQDLATRFPRPDVPPSLNASHAMLATDSSRVTSREWHAAEMLLHSARILEEESVQAVQQGNVAKAEERAAMVRRLRTEVLSLLSKNSEP